MNRRIISLFAITLCLSFSSLCFAQGNQTESVTITTYYPSPYGVYRNVRLYPTSVPTGPAARPGVMFFDDINNTVRYLNNNNQWVNLTPNYWVLNPANQNIHNINSGGKVGIGTAAPGYYLDVQGTAATGILYRRTDARDARITVADPTQTWSLASGWATAGDFSIIQEGVSGNRLYMAHSSGNVGIGTSNPLCKLQVSQTGASGVGLFVGNAAPIIGQALIETNMAGSSTHAWFAEGGNRVFSVTAGGAVTAQGDIQAPNNKWGGCNTIRVGYLASHAGFTCPDGQFLAGFNMDCPGDPQSNDGMDSAGTGCFPIVATMVCCKI